MKSLSLKPAWVVRALDYGLPYFSMVILVLLSLMATISEIFGIGIFLPIFQFIRLDGDLNALVADSSLWQYIIDIFLYFNIETSLLALLIVAFIFFIFRQIFIFIRIVYSSASLYRIVQLQRDKIFSKYIDASTSYHDETPVGDIINVVITEAHRASVSVIVPLQLSVYFIMFAGYGSVLLMLSWQMTLFAVVVFLLISTIPKTWIKKSKETGRKLVNANTSISEFLVDRLRSPRLVRLSGIESSEKKEFYFLTNKLRKHAVHSSILQAKTEVTMEPALVVVSLVFLYFSYTVFHLQVEIIGIYLLISMRLMPIVKGIVVKLQAIQNMVGSVELLEKRLNKMDISKEKDNGTKVIKKIEKSILIDNVSYAYLKSKNNVLNNISVEFKVHDMIAIVGPSGSGKSTMIDLFPRLRLPSNGSIKIDGENINNFSLKSLRRLISYTPQSPQIFNGTVKNHILCGKRDASDEEVLEAIRLSGLERFIEKLPQGINTFLGEGAIKLSGGQRQRLDLARALVSKSDVLILDEPTSNLDIESQRTFKKVLDLIRKERNTTIIIVTHHLSNIADADQIVVFNEGRIEAAGTHSELILQKGWYSKMYKL
jgi:ABC-type multidrug transport system fused ATPase/permease subunit